MTAAALSESQTKFGGTNHTPEPIKHKGTRSRGRKGGGGGSCRGGGGGVGGGTADGGSDLRPLCFRHLRFESCHNRRCKFSHTFTIARYRDLSGGGDGDDDGDSAVDSTSDEPPLEHIPSFRIVACSLSPPAETRTDRLTMHSMQDIVSGHIVHGLSVRDAG